MPSLYIRDEQVTELADKLKKLTRAPTRTDAVRNALLEALVRTSAQLSIDDRLAPALDAARKLGPARPGFDYKAFKDAGWIL